MLGGVVDSGLLSSPFLVQSFHPMDELGKAIEAPILACNPWDDPLPLNRD